jgi:hypothetical protein
MKGRSQGHGCRAPKTRLHGAWYERREDRKVETKSQGASRNHAGSKKNPAHQSTRTEPPTYEIRIEGHLGDQWADWFDGLIISQEQDGITLLSGPIADQAALHGMLVKIRNLCLPLISVNRVNPPHKVNDQGNRILTRDEY